MSGNLMSLIPSCLRGSSWPPTRVYHVWPGKNVFFLDGRVICGPDPRGLVMVAMAVLLSEWTFLAYIVDPLSTHPILVVLSSLILTAKVTSSLLLTATRDPGIVPRNPASPSEEDGIGTSTRAPSWFVVVNGVKTRLKFCRSCNIFRPPRSSHCAICDNCVDKFDHHCPWISQCIGLRNYRFYLLCICSGLAFYTFMFMFAVRRIVVTMGTTGAGLFSLLTKISETFALAAFSFMAICFLACLLAFHAFLVAKNKTSHESNKGMYRNSPDPYDRGALANIKECLFEKLPPPRVDFRAVIEPDMGSAARPTTNSPIADDAGRRSSNA
ncbi:hypothetical protein ACP70R_005742 [Stipagrostis hirtigluma subsp. patula]